MLQRVRFGDGFNYDTLKNCEFIHAYIMSADDPDAARHPHFIGHLACVVWYEHASGKTIVQDIIVGERSVA